MASAMPMAFSLFSGNKPSYKPLYNIICSRCDSCYPVTKEWQNTLLGLCSRLFDRCDKLTWGAQWSLSGSIGSYKGIQYQVRGLAGSQGTDQWSLDSSMGPYDVLHCHKRGYTGFRGAVYWSLNGSRGSYGILQSHTRGCTESPDAGQWSLSGTRWA